MPSKSKEENILRLLLENSPLREWHFEEIVKESGVTRAVANKWLKRYQEEGLIRREKKKGSFPHFTIGQNNPIYQARKRLYALSKIHETGLLAELLSMKEAKTIILFGSMIKGDWYKGSDIDIFILGKTPKINKKAYETRLRHDIELHVFENRQELKEIKTGLLKNVANGYLVKGQMQDVVA
ncbi:nucleotidyltransferase domain-containing protein [Candidatus Woesearchaeota archaeon]|nr:nucleotidyltransferase domain-containing protein [Candidatus Woesearchaeota archaeon]